MKIKDIIVVGKDDMGFDGYNVVIELNNGDIIYLRPGDKFENSGRGTDGENNQMSAVWAERVAGRA